MQVAASHAPPLIDISTPDTPALSVAVPLMVKGSGEVLFIKLASAGLVTVDEGIPLSIVMYKNGYDAAIGLPATSVMAVDTVTV